MTVYASKLANIIKAHYLIIKIVFWKNKYEMDRFLPDVSGAALDLKNFLGLGAGGVLPTPLFSPVPIPPRRDVKDVDPHFPTTPADFDATAETKIRKSFIT